MAYYFGMINGAIPNEIPDPFIFNEICCRSIGYYPRYEICGCPAFTNDLYTECISSCSHSKIYMDESYIRWSIHRNNLLQIHNIVRDIDKTISYLDEDALPCHEDIHTIFLYMVGRHIIDAFKRFQYEDELLFTSYSLNQS